MPEDPKYPQYVNGRQTKRDRRCKYGFLRAAGLSVAQCDRMRDWTMNHIVQFLFENKTKYERRRALDMIPDLRKAPIIDGVHRNDGVLSTSTETGIPAPEAQVFCDAGHLQAADVGPSVLKPIGGR